MGGVVARHVQPVHHAGELSVDHAHHTLHALGIGGVVKLGGVGGADGGNSVGHQHGALHQVHIAVHLEGAVVVPAAIQPEQLVHGVRAVASLILDVVDREHRADAAHRLPAGADILKIDGHQRRLPVVAVEDVGHPVQTGHQVDDRLAEKGEALAVVVLAVQRAAAEIVLVVHEVPCHAVLLQREQAAVLMAPAQVHVDVAAEGHLLPPLLADLAIQRQDHRHLVAVSGQCRGQAARHVRQSAGLAEGECLAGHIQDLHTAAPFSGSAQTVLPLAITMG